MPPEAERSNAVTLLDGDLDAMSKNERIKVASEGLYWVANPKDGDGTSFLDEVTALESKQAETLSNTAKELSKFFGVYRQQARGARGKKTQDHFMMVRIKCPAGGRLSSAQWLALDEAADQFADGTLRVTSRQGIQYHRVYGTDLAPMIRHLNRGYRDHGTLGACGDVNRNVMASPMDALDPESEVGGLPLGHAIADELSPKSNAYFQIFMSDEEGRNAGPVHADEPLYGPQYLPRKFKIGIAGWRDNSVDVLTQDVGLVPRDAQGSRFDLYTGGGLGLTHNNPSTAAHVGLYLGSISRDEVVAACRAIVVIQKENGDRKNRKQARWKYTIRRIGTDATKQQLRERFEIDLRDEPAVEIPPLDLHLGWHAQRGGGGYYGISVDSGRIQPKLREALREAVETLSLSVVLTPQQDVVLCDVPDEAKLLEILDRHDVARPDAVSAVRRGAMACPAKPTCGLAMTDAENVLPMYLSAIEEAGLGDTDVVIRMTGCPNNCARPPSAEIGIYGYGKNDHVVLVGGARNGSRLAHVLFERLPGEQMVPALVGLCRAIRDHAAGRPAGDFLHETDPETLRGWVGVDA